MAAAAATHIATTQDPTASPRSAINNGTSVADANGVTSFQSNAASHYHAILLAKLRFMAKKIREFTENFRVTGIRKSNPLYIERLRTIILPSLIDNFDRLDGLLFGNYASDRTDEPACLFQAALEALMEAEQTINLVQRLDHSLWTASEGVKPASQDLSRFRGRLTEEKIHVLWKSLDSLFASYATLFPFCGIFKTRINWIVTAPHMVNPVATVSRPARETTHSFLHWLYLSDFRVLQHSWLATLMEVDKTLLGLTQLRHEASPQAVFAQSYPDFIVVVKLTRVILKKLSSPNSHELAQMPANEHAALLTSTSRIELGLEVLVRHLYDRGGRPDQASAEPAEPLSGCLMETYKILRDYFQLQEGLNRPGYREIRNWLTLWNQLFSLAVKRLQSTHRRLLSAVTPRAPPRH